MFKSLRSKLITVCASVTALSLLGLAGANYLSTARQQEKAIQEVVASTTESNSALLASWVKTKYRATSALRGAVGAESPLPILTAGLTSGGNALAFIGHPDKSYVYSDATGMPENFDPTSRPWYKQAVAARQPALTDPYVSSLGHTKGKLVVTVSEPVYKDGQLIAVVGANTSLEEVIKDVAAIKPSPNSFAFLVNDKGLVIAHPTAELTLKQSTDILPELNAAKIDELVKREDSMDVVLNDRPVYLHGVKIEGSNWILVLAFDKADANAGLYALVKSSIITLTLAVLLSGFVVSVVVSRMLRRLAKVQLAMQDVASGEADLTIRLASDGNDEISSISQAYNQFADKLLGIIKGIRTNSESVKLGAAEIAQGNLDLSSRTEQQAGALEETAASMEELTSTVKQSADNALQASQLVKSFSTSAEKGGTIMTQVSTTMSDIRVASDKISDITSVIDSIAFQTNILALNAAVEAARAGEQGRGFAVVASEVRALAHRSAEAAKQIKGLITDSKDKVTHGVQLAEQAGQVMTEIVSSVNRVSDITSEISAAAQEQSMGIRQVNESIIQMDSVTQQNAALVEEAAAAASSLELQAEELSAAVAQFKLDR